MSSEKPVLDEAWSFFLSRQRVPSEILYHFTSRVAVGNILKTHTMWATDLRFMNDPEELRYSLNVIEGVLDNALLAERDGQRALWFALMKRQFRELLTQSCFYSISFTELADGEKQWKEYGDNGGGLALGWNVDSPHPEVPLRIGVVYDLNDQKELLRKLIAIHIDSFRNERDLTRGSGLEKMSRAGGSLGIFLDICVSNFKQESWAVEREYRYVYQALNGRMPAGTVLKSRPAGPIEKPYIETDFSKAELRRVIAGPRCEPVATARWLRETLDSTGFTKTQMYRSDLRWE